MSSDKVSVRLPKTSFPMKANLTKLQEKVKNAWESKQTYEKIFAKNKDNKPFILHDGPPYANGNLHVGHALNKILKDIIVKSYITRGYSAPFVLGWDCHGLPIEWKIEEKYRKKKIRKEEIDVVSFRKECNDFAHSWVDIQTEEFKALGVLADFKNSYLTTDFKAEATIVESIFNLLKREIIYQDKKPVLWSCVEQTALAEAEVEYQDKISDTAFIGFKVVNFPKENWLGSYALIWTTTPWTIPANQALAYHKDIEYGLYEIISLNEEAKDIKNKKIIIAKELKDTICNALKIKEIKELDTSIGLEGLKANHPLFDKGFDYNVGAFHGDYVSAEGTGVVHTAPSHGEDDFYLCKKEGIKPIEVVLESGYYRDTLPLFGGKHIFKIAPEILEALSEVGTLFANEKLEHSYPHSWRSKAPLIYHLTSQWFISLDKENTRKNAIEALENVEFYPKKGENRLRSMLENRPDWCISRQRSWGVPLSIFIHKETKEPLIDEELFTNIITAFTNKGSNAWFEDNPKNFLPEKYNKEDYIAISDVVDVWIDSGLTHNFVLKQNPNLSFPADIYLEGSDQHRGWFQSSLVMSILILGVAPYKRVITHGFTLDEKGHKMSKSLGNVVVPEKVIKEQGADILRLWVASCNYVEDVHIGQNIINQQVETYRKIRNTLRYLLANLNEFQEEITYEDLTEIDKWLLHHLYLIDKEYEHTFSQSYNIHSFFAKLFNFIIVDLSSFYFDIKKDILYCESCNSKEFKSTLTTFNIILKLFFKWLSPFIPFTMEEVYATRYNVEIGELFLQDFATSQKNWNHPEIFTKWEKIKKIRKVITGSLEEKRHNKEIGSSLESFPIVYTTKENISLLNSINFEDVCIVSGISIKELSELTSKEELFSLVEVPDVFVEFYKAEGKKCERCWKFFNNLKENNLCERCYEVIKND